MQILLINYRQAFNRMKKIKYGSRDKTKEKKNPYIQQLKDDDDDVCGAVLDSFSNQYLSYISGLVKATKTPSKMRTQERIDSLFEQKQQNSKSFESKQTPINITSKAKSRQISPKSPNYSDIKNSTLPIKHIKQLNEIDPGLHLNMNIHNNQNASSNAPTTSNPIGNQQNNLPINNISNNESGQIRKQREKGSTGSVFEKILHTNQHPFKLDRKFNLKQHYNRFPTQEAQKLHVENKFQHTSIACRSEESERVREQPGKQFLQGLDEYLVTLQSNRNYKRPQGQGRSKFSHPTLDQLLQENTKLQRKLQKYEKKTIQIQQHMESHFTFCKKQERTNKAKITDLTKALLRAISKINQQKQELDFLKDELKYFGKKVQICVDKYDQQSGDEEDICEEVVRAMRPRGKVHEARPSRASSEYKIKRKSELEYRD